jgi:hypothetical protein
VVGSWGGPRVVNDDVVNRTTVVNVTNITVYKNVQVHNAVVDVPAAQFGHGTAKPSRIAQSELRQLAPVHGPLEVRPVAAIVMSATDADAVAPSPTGQRGGDCRVSNSTTSAIRESARASRSASPRLAMGWGTSRNPKPGSPTLARLA